MANLARFSSPPRPTVAVPARSTPTPETYIGRSDGSTVLSSSNDTLTPMSVGGNTPSTPARDDALVDKGSGPRTGTATNRGSTAMRSTKWAPPSPAPRPFGNEQEPSFLKEYVPVNIRQFAAHMTGDRTPLTEKHLAESDIGALRQAVQRDIARNTKNGKQPTQGVIGYGDYPDEGKHWSAGVGREVHSPAGVIANSYASPTYRMETTLGAAHWRKLPDGSILIEDKYNFNGARTDVDGSRVLKNKGPLELIKRGYQESGVSGALREAGWIYGAREGSQSDRGNPVRIKLRLK